MKRRQFLGGAAAATITLSHVDELFAWAPQDRYRDAMGIQLYTLRDALAKDVKGTLKVVADAGYRQVEPFGFPATMAMVDAAKELGLEVNSTHFASDSIVDPDNKSLTPFRKVLDTANDIGLTHLVIPFLTPQYRKSLDDYRRLAENCNKAAEQAKQVGIQLSYHNHSFEFEPHEDGVTGYDIMVQRFSPEMKFEVDVFWVRVGGEDPVELIRSLKGRVCQLHLKDLNADIATPAYGSVADTAFEECGDGIIDMKPIIDVAEEVGVELCHVEQDQSPHPLKSIKMSIDHLKSI